MDKCACDPNCEFPSDGGCGYEETISYCDLHAAAPALLEALERLSETVVTLGGHKTESLEKARAAIAQAKGEQL